MSENGFWITVWVIGTTGVIALGLIITNYQAYQIKTMDELIREGHDPIAVMCAIDPPGNANPLCLMYLKEHVNGMVKQP